MTTVTYSLSTSASIVSADIEAYPSEVKILGLPSFSTIKDRVITIKTLVNTNPSAILTLNPAGSETINTDLSYNVSSFYSLTVQALSQDAGGGWGILNRYPALLNSNFVSSISNSVIVNAPTNSSLLFVDLTTQSKTIVLPYIGDITPASNSSYTYTIKDINGNASLSTLYISSSGGNVIDSPYESAVALNYNYSAIDLVANPVYNGWQITNYYYGSLSQETLSLAFEYTGADKSFIVPSFVPYLRLYMWGAGGGIAYTQGSYSLGGGGAGFVSGVLTTTPGETLTLVVGQGPWIQNAESGSNYASVYGGGGPGSDGGASVIGCSPGGGRSAILRGATEVVTAGGGGGGGPYNFGGAGGGLVGFRGDGIASSNANNVSINGGQGFGGGGGQTAPGQGSRNPLHITSLDITWQGDSGSGTTGGGALFNATGSGGGGYFGGGAGAAYGSGGGGSSYIANLSNAYTEGGVRVNPGAKKSQLRTNNAGQGATVSAKAGDGLILFLYP